MKKKKASSEKLRQQRTGKASRRKTETTASKMTEADNYDDEVSVPLWKTDIVLEIFFFPFCWSIDCADVVVIDSGGALYCCCCGW